MSVNSLSGSSALNESSVRYAASPWSIGWSAWWEVAKRAGSNASTHRLSLTAAGVAFFGFLSLFPAIAAMVFIYGLVADVGDLRSNLEALSTILPAQTVEILFQRLEAVVNSRNASGVGIGILVSVALAFWSGSRGVAALMELIGVAYRQPSQRSFLREAALSLVMSLGMLAMLVITLFLIAVLPAVLNYTYISGILISTLAADLANLLRWPLVLLLFCASLCLVYKISPDRRDARLRWVLPGALVATLVWGLMSVLFSLYVENFGNYDATFGSLAAIVVLLLWMYYSVAIVALGAELNAELELATRVDTTVGPSRPMGRRGAVVADNVNQID